MENMKLQQESLNALYNVSTCTIHPYNNTSKKIK